ncbi:MAG: LuxR C-terminal-related transcriptional regulator [candidate division Zixibacteria bacterium]|nr:LuxR C-terminal-related transcriptional regulator [candidate division Zixibacteria bacterium]MDD5425371.1 LuxR C-terminal-related transcriptional regulator [candidate division Zixibacteria bacterium]
MVPRKEMENTEILIGKLLLRLYASENLSIDKLRHDLRWHIDNSLSTRQEQVMKYFLNGKKEREIAHILGITQQVVNIYKQRAIKKLNKLLID